MKVSNRPFDLDAAERPIGGLTANFKRLNADGRSRSTLHDSRTSDCRI